MKVVLKISVKFDRNILLCPDCGFCVYSSSNSRKCARCEHSMKLVCKESVYKKASKGVPVGIPTIINGCSIY